MKKNIAVLSVLAAVALTACGSEPVAPVVDTLTRAESIALLQAIEEQTLEILGAAGSLPVTSEQVQRMTRVASTSSGAVPQPFAIPLTATEICDSQSGSVSLSGTATGLLDDVGLNSLEISALITHRNCRIDTGATGTFDISGAPNIQLKSSLRFVGGVPQEPVELSMRGTVAWRNAGRSGECALDLTVLTSITTSRDEVRGTFCGIAVNESR
ncbi:MAG: hypothetical protein WKF55_05580 [Gemmatimonadaceae bacterium]